MSNLNKTILALFLIPLSLISQKNHLKNWANSSVFQEATVAVMLADIDKDSILFSHNAEKNMITASTMKLITSAAGLKTLGPDFKFKTELRFSDTIVNGVLEGDLIIKGYGDPTLGSKYFYDQQTAFINQWVNEIEKLGIKEIKGNIIGDGSYYGKTTTPYGWQWSDISNYYGTSPEGLNVIDNQYIITFNSGTAGTTTTIKKIQPSVPYLELTNKVISSDKSGDNSYILGGPNEYKKEIQGTITANDSAFEVKGSIPNPSKFLAYLLLEALKNKGVKIDGTYLSHFDQEINPKSQLISTLNSPSLKEIIKITNKYSINLFAEAIALEITKKVGAKDYQSALNKVFNNEIDFSKNTIADGSGLSPANTISANNYYKVLRLMHRDKILHQPFMESLSVSGSDGTLKSFGQGKKFAGHFIGKSGYIGGIRCYAGFLKSAKGKNLALIIFVNHYSSENSVIKNKIEELVEQIHQEF